MQMSQNGVITGNNINLNAQNTLLNQSGDITATNNLNLKAKTGVLLKSSSVALAK
jgi:lipopolysaccharide assembly outer membrane protein LptD (OstA)